MFTHESVQHTGLVILTALSKLKTS